MSKIDLYKIDAGKVFMKYYDIICKRPIPNPPSLTTEKQKDNFVEKHNDFQDSCMETKITKKRK